MNRCRGHHERGSAMFVAILLVTVGFLTLLAVSELAGTNFRRTDDFLAREQSFYAAVGGTEYVVSDIWGKFNTRREELNPEYSFRGFLDSALSFGAGTLTNGAMLEVSEYNGVRLGNATISRVRLSRSDYNDPSGSNTLFTDLLVEVEATTELGESVWASRVLGTKSKLPFAGLDYAVLTKNITCSLCHMRVQSLGKALNTNSGYFGQYGKIRVGTTELLAMRPGSAETLIEGALYHRGRIEEEFSGNAISYTDVIGSTVKTVLQDVEKGSVKQNLTNGAVEVTNLSSTGVPDTSSFRMTNSIDDDKDGTVNEGDEGSATRDRDGIDNDGNGQVDEPDEVVLFDPKGQRRVNSTTGVPNRNDSLYLEYPKVQSQMQAADGELPVDKLVDRFDPSKDIKAFPEPFKDTNKNRYIDADEIATQVGTATNKYGTGPGTLSAEIGVMLAPGEVYGSGSLPQAAGNTVKVAVNSNDPYSTYQNRTTSGVSLTSDPLNPIRGTMILVGTADDPILIDGKVVIEGDVMISGVVQGEGQIYATGNVYIPNDVKYNNRAPDKFGESPVPDGAGGYKRNLLGITSGGSIMVGDYLSTVTHWNSSKTNFYDYGIPEAGQKLDRAQLPRLPSVDLNHMGGDVNSANTNYTNFANFVMEELSFFNQSELARVTKTSKVGTNTNESSAWTQNNRYDPATNPNGLWRVPQGEPTSTASTSYVPRFYRMYGEFPTPPDATPTLDYGKSYQAAAGSQDNGVSSTRSQPVIQSELRDSSIPFYINRATTWQTSKGYYNNTNDPHTYNSISELKLKRNASTGLYDYDTDFFNGGASGDPLNPTTGTSNKDNRIPQGVLDMGAVSKARVIDLHPSWITPTNMLNLLLTEEQRRPDDTPRQVDGLLYTNNAIFMIERKQTQKHSGTYDPATGQWTGGSWSKVQTKSRGSFIVNGAIIAPDLGILVTGGTKTSGSEFSNSNETIRNGSFRHERQAFTVNYDPRVKDLLYGISDTIFWNTNRKGWGRSMGSMPD